MICPPGSPLFHLEHEVSAVVSIARHGQHLGAHLALNGYGSSFSTAVSTSVRLQNHTSSADATVH